MSMYKIGAVGERDALMAFLAIGISIKAVENAEDAKNAVNKMADDGYGLIFITENTAKDIK
ncbi:MAG TPA: V-type ATP synthase subunit F, partial [Clostridiaceae bacterium]|nr:V-type ATP synthase subunit F [Clostridiaceae bacterium]